MPEYKYDTKNLIVSGVSWTAYAATLLVTKNTIVADNTRAVVESLGGVVSEKESDSISSKVATLCARAWGITLDKHNLTEMEQILKTYNFAKTTYQWDNMATVQNRIIDVAKTYHSSRLLMLSKEIARDVIMQLATLMDDDSTLKLIDLLQAIIARLDSSVNVENKISPKYPMFISDRPYDLTAGFMGREKIVENVAEEIKSKNSIILTGIGGIGKTEVAKAIIKKIEKERTEEHGITRIAWVNYDNRNIFYSIIKALTETQKLDDYEQAWSKANSIIYTYRDELLLVIDNVDTLEDGNLLRIADMPCRLLITSRIDKISSIKAISVDNLSTDTCVDLFLMYYKMNPAPVYYIRKIIQLADKHTVTIELLAKIAQIEEIRIEDFYQKLVNLGFNLSIEKAASHHEKLQKEDRIINQLSILFSVCHLNYDEEGLIVPISVIPSLYFDFQQAQKWFAQKNRSLLIKLSKSGWLQTIFSNDHTYYSMHSVIAAAVRYQYKKVLYDRCRDFICSLTKELQYKEDEHGTEKIDIIKFSWSVTDLLESDLHEETDADFLYYLSRIYIDIGNYQQALRLLCHTIRIYKRQERIKPRNIFNTYLAIGSVYDEIRDYSHALTQYKKAMKMLKRITATSIELIPLYKNLGATFMALEGIKSDGYANAYLSEAFELAKYQYGDNDSRTLDIEFMLANCIAEKNPDTAKVIFQEVINKEESIHGTCHWTVADRYKGYGNFLYDLGDFKQAEIMLEKALAIYKEKFGEKHPTTADVKNTLGLINLYINPTKAQQYFQDHLNCSVEIFGEKSSVTALAWSNLGLSYFYDGNYNQALEMFQNASNILITLNSNHSEELGTYYSNQAQCYDQMKQFNKAIEYYSYALNEYKHNVVSTGDKISALYGRIADTYVHLGNKEKAYEYFQKAEDGFKNVWGQYKVPLASIYNNYAMLLESDQNYNQALLKLEAAEKILLDAYQNSSEPVKVIRENINRLRSEIYGDA